MPTTPTLRRILRDRVLAAAAMLIGAAAATAVIFAFMPTITATDSYQVPPTRAEVLVERHDCWTGDAPHGEIPARAVVTLPGEHTQIAPAQIGFDIWLDGHPGTLHAFCP